MSPLALPPPSAALDSLPDKDITAAIELFFITKKGVVANLIGVTTKVGIVELTGATNSLLARDRAEEIALAVRGVRGVINELVVITDAVPDEQLQLDVCRALANDPAARDYNLRCTASQGSVAVTGTVLSWAEKQLALRVVRGVRGVREVTTERLTVCWGERLRTDAEITTHLQEMLDWDIRVNPHLLRVRTAGQVVHLAGTVGSATEKARLEALACQAGASRVEATEVRVAPWALDPHLRREKFAPRPDDAVAQALRDVLDRDPRTRAFPLLVHVRDGVATLTGSVNSLGTKQAAELDARHVVGVWEVHSLLKVRPERTWLDPCIRQAITGALARDPYLSDVDFTVNVLEGKVYLYGRVGSRYEQEHARRLAANTIGVVAVESHLTTRQAEPAPGPEPAAALFADHALAERVRTRCFWSAGLHGQAIEVQVANGRATLTGTVDTWLARQLAAREAAEAGAREVNNHLVVPESAAVAC